MECKERAESVQKNPAGVKAAAMAWATCSALTQDKTTNPQDHDGDFGSQLHLASLVGQRPR